PRRVHGMIHGMTAVTSLSQLCRLNLDTSGPLSRAHGTWYLEAPGEVGGRTWGCERMCTRCVELEARVEKLERQMAAVAEITTLLGGAFDGAAAALGDSPERSPDMPRPTLSAVA